MHYIEWPILENYKQQAWQALPQESPNVPLPEISEESMSRHRGLGTPLLGDRLGSEWMAGPKEANRREGVAGPRGWAPNPGLLPVHQ